MTASFQDQDGPSDTSVQEADSAGGGTTHQAPDFLTLAQRAQIALEAGKFDEAREAFLGIVEVLPERPSYQHAVALERVGFCLLMEGQPLAAAGFLQKSTEIVEDIEPTEAARALQGVIQSELGQIFSGTGHVGQAKEAYEAAVEIARDLGDKRALAIDLDHLGVLELRQGHIDLARKHLDEALALFRDLSQKGAQAVVLHHLGLVAEHAQQWEIAEKNYADAAELLVGVEDYESATRLLVMAAVACIKDDRGKSAEAWYRKALEHARLGLNPLDLRHTLSNFAKLLQAKPGGLEEARDLIEEALAAGENSLEPDVWHLYGQLADIVEQQAAESGDAGAVQALRSAAQNYRHIHRYGPRLLATLKEIGEEPSFGAAVILERIGRCCLIGGRPAPAVILFRQAAAALDTLPESDTSKGLRGILLSAMGDAYRLAGFPDDALKSYQSALEVAKSLGDLRGELVQLTHLGAFALASDQVDAAARHFRAAVRIARDLGEKEICTGLEQQLASVATSIPQDTIEDTGNSLDTQHDAPFSVRVQSEFLTECAFGSDLLIEARRETRLELLDTTKLEPVAADVKPALAPLVRTALDEQGCLRFHVPQTEPQVFQEQDCVVMRKLRREIIIDGDLEDVWTLVRLADGSLSLATILAKIDEDKSSAIAQLVAALVDLGVYDISGRSIARFVHAATKKGVLAGGGLDGEGVIDLVTDGNYRTFLNVPKTALGGNVPESIAAFHAVTRARRSRRDYNGDVLPRAEFDALLHTACGVTGATSWSDREVKLRAYPSSGALYAVEIYPVVFGVEGLEPGIYHYAVAENALEAVRLEGDLAAFIDACLPVEREMVSGAGAMICLVGEFRRHETKYGEGGYRMMVAEAGHISQNLVLSATALGLSARPFGGVFDALINRQLGLQEDEEQFLLSVLVGYTAGEEQPGIGQLSKELDP